MEEFILIEKNFLKMKNVSLTFRKIKVIENSSVAIDIRIQYSCLKWHVLRCGLFCGCPPGSGVALDRPGCRFCVGRVGA